MQFLSDLSEFLIGQGLSPQSVTGTLQGSSLNCQNFHVDTALVLSVGDTSGGFTSAYAQLEEWDGTSHTTWAAVTGLGSSTAIMLGNSMTTATSPQVILGLRQYGFVRVNVLTFNGGATPAIQLSANVFGMPRSSQSNTGFSLSPSS